MSIYIQWIYRAKWENCFASLKIKMTLLIMLYLLFNTVNLALKLAWEKQVKSKIDSWVLLNSNYCKWRHVFYTFVCSICFVGDQALLIMILQKLEWVSFYMRIVDHKPHLKSHQPQLRRSNQTLHLAPAESKCHSKLIPTIFGSIKF